ncbi:MAG: hypothetical protein HY719_10255 [Planctomycetes bacterium]|nr:hypothetical protein [Planctomycetota bacterium]
MLFALTESEAIASAPGWEEPAPLQAIVRVEPGEMHAEELLLRRLGTRGWGRIRLFRDFYQPGWGAEQRGAPMSPRALSNLLRFLEAYEFPPKSAPSVFLTDRGGIEIA